MVKIPKSINNELKVNSKDWKHLTKSKILDLKKRIKKSTEIILVDRFYDNNYCRWIDFESNDAGYVWKFEKSQMFGTSEILKEIALSQLPRNPSSIYFYEDDNGIHLFYNFKNYSKEWITKSIYFN